MLGAPGSPSQWTGEMGHLQIPSGHQTWLDRKSSIYRWFPAKTFIYVGISQLATFDCWSGGYDWTKQNSFLGFNQLQILMISHDSEPRKPGTILVPWSSLLGFWWCIKIRPYEHGLMSILSNSVYPGPVINVYDTVYTYIYIYIIIIIIMCPICTRYPKCISPSISILLIIIGYITRKKNLTMAHMGTTSACSQTGKNSWRPSHGTSKKLCTSNHINIYWNILYIQ